MATSRTELTDRDRAEMTDCLAKMKAASGAFYLNAIHTGNHAFIEFCGLMNEYIAICEDRMREGIDFRHLNKHTGNFELLPHRLAYLNEKIDCIYGVEFRTETVDIDIDNRKRPVVDGDPIVHVGVPSPPGARRGHEPGCESLYGDYHCTCQ